MAKLKAVSLECAIGFNWVCLVILLAGCSVPVSQPLATAPIPAYPLLASTPSRVVLPASPTPFLPAANTPTAKPVFSIWINPAVPQGLSHSIRLAAPLQPVEKQESALFQVDFSAAADGNLPVLKEATWIYALVAPFPTLVDGVTRDDLLQAWRGTAGGDFKGRPILLDQNTLDVFQKIWGMPGSQAVRVLPAGQLLDVAWGERPSWALVPFESLEPRWKVLAVDGMSPLQKDFTVDGYFLSVHLALMGQPSGLVALKKNASIDLASLVPATNRDPQKMTVVIMTGVTGLVRALAYRMEIRSITYPGEAIAGWLRSADFTHISNEVSFTSTCPYPQPLSLSLLFCSRESYLGLLDYVGANIIELTGNHNLDWGEEAALNTLDLYQQRGWHTFGGGRNLEDAQKPLLIDHHGNRLAFIGCNLVGPVEAWATPDHPGAAPCGDKGWMVSQIKAVRSAGYLPIVTFQYSENYTDTAGYQEKADYRSMVDAGAVIVDGSQAHTPKGMEFYQDGFIHYGLGNLFFDQMEVQVGDKLVTTTQDEFIDRHVFYAGRYIGVDLLTARLENWARPRPMSESERNAFLKVIFAASGWYNEP